MKTVNEQILDETISHQIGLQGYSTATVRKIIALINRAELDVVEQIREVNDLSTVTRLNKLLVNLRAVLKEAYGVINGTLDEELLDLSKYEAEFQESMITAAVPIKLDLEMPTAAKLSAAVNSRPFQGRLLKEWYAQLEEAAQVRLRGAVRMGFTEGATVDDIVRRVRGTKGLQYRDGVTEISRRGAEALVRTAVSHTANSAREAVYKENTDVISAVQWVSTLDSRTTLICISRDGKTYPPGTGPRPPAHINCRSTTVPVIKSWKELGINLSEAPPGTRASMDGQVAETTTYNSWLKTRSVSFQEEVLGKARAKLFREGGLNVDRFVDRNGRGYTLEELRNREAEAFKAAGL